MRDYSSEKALKEIEDRFTYHKPVGDQPERYTRLRSDAKIFADSIERFCPNSREKSLAHTHLQLAVMLANSSIALNEVGDLAHKIEEVAHDASSN